MIAPKEGWSIRATHQPLWSEEVVDWKFETSNARLAIEPHRLQITCGPVPNWRRGCEHVLFVRYTKPEEVSSKPAPKMLERVYFACRYINEDRSCNCLHWAWARF